MSFEYGIYIFYDRVRQFGRGEVVYQADRSHPESGPWGRGVNQGGERAPSPVQEVCSDGEENGRHQRTFQG